MKAISFAIPCYNSAAYMDTCIESIMACVDERDDIEIIIVDDGSTKDDTAVRADEWQKRHPSVIKAVHQPNGGHGEAVNTGLANATGLYFGTMLLKTGRAQGLVSGACHPTKDVLSPALRVIKTKPGTKVVSSFFIMEVPNEAYGDDGLMLFSDCAVCIQPNAEELSEIAVASARSFKDLTGAEPRVAMLSHATKGSVIDDDAAKVIEATRLAREKAPDCLIDGELQADAAIVQSVGASKAPDSSVAGCANVLVFPDLDAANIGYKLVQRLAGANAFGPITQGLNAPMNDLSRGCSAEDIVAVVAITAVQAQGIA